MVEKKPPTTPSYRRHKSNGLDRAFVELNGKRVYVGRYATPESRQRYDRIISEWLANGRLLRPARRLLTVAELCTRFKQHARTYYRRPDGTLTSELQSIRRALRPLTHLYGNTPAEEFGPMALQAVRHQMIGLGWCRSQINKQVSRIRLMFRWAAGNELMPAAVHQALKTVAGLAYGRCEARETEPIRPAPRAHIDAVQPHVSRQVWALIQLQLSTGARAGELVKLCPIDLDTSGKVWTATLHHHKTAHHGRERVLYFGPHAQVILRQFMNERALNAYLFSPSEADAERRAALHAARRTPLSCGNRPGTNRRDAPERRPGDHYTVTSYRRAIHRGCEAAGVDQWSPHRLRHNAATELRRQFGLEGAQLLLGHARADVTQLYAEIDRSKAVELAAKIG